MTISASDIESAKQDLKTWAIDFHDNAGDFVHKAAQRSIDGFLDPMTVTRTAEGIAFGEWLSDPDEPDDGVWLTVTIAVDPETDEWITD